MGNIVCIGSVCWGDQWQNCGELWIGQWVLLTCIFKGCAMIFQNRREIVFYPRGVRRFLPVEVGQVISQVLDFRPLFHAWIYVIKKLENIIPLREVWIPATKYSHRGWVSLEGVTIDCYRPECHCYKVSASGELDWTFE